MGNMRIEMPQLGESVTEGTVDRWLKQEGDSIERDEPLVEVITDKVTAEIPSPYAGRLSKITVQAGEKVDVGAELAQIETADASSSPSTEPEISQEEVSSLSETSERSRLSPAVRRLASEAGVDLSQIKGSGALGRITREDVLAFIEQHPRGTYGEDELVSLTPMRQSIAEHMSKSVTTSPHAWTLQEADISALVSYRNAEKEAFQQRHGVPLTYLPLISQVVCQGLKKFPYLNSSWTAEGILLKRHINLGIAVSLPDGLIVPVIKDADKLGLVDLARAIHDLVTRAREGKLLPQDVQGGTFTLNNTGATGSVASYPIINQPQAAILTMEAIIRRPVVVEESVAIRSLMNICLAFDHRIIDGMMAGQFLTFIRETLTSDPNNPS